MPSNVLPLHLKQTFPPIIWFFTEGDGIESRLPFEIFSTLHSCVSSFFLWSSCHHSFVVYANLTFDYSRAINFRANLAIICQFYWHCAIDCIVCSVSGSESWRKSGNCCCHQTLSFNSFVTGRNTVVWWEVIKNCTTATNLKQKNVKKLYRSRAGRWVIVLKVLNIVHLVSSTAIHNWLRIFSLFLAKKKS